MSHFRLSYSSLPRLCLGYSFFRSISAFCHVTFVLPSVVAYNLSTIFTVFSPRFRCLLGPLVPRALETSIRCGSAQAPRPGLAPSATAATAAVRPRFAPQAPFGCACFHSSIFTLQLFHSSRLEERVSSQFHSVCTRFHMCTFLPRASVSSSALGALCSKATTSQARTLR